MAPVAGGVWRMVVDIVSFWQNKLYDWYHRRSPVDVWLDILRNAESFEEWEEAALHLDNLLGLDLWRNNPTSRHYDYMLIHERLLGIVAAREAGNVPELVNLLRSGLVRNLGNITVPKLYNRSFAGTKYLIEEYITQVAETIEDIAGLPTSTAADDGIGLLSLMHVTGDGGSNNGNYNGGGRRLTGVTMSTQMKLDLAHDTRQAFGRSTLVLQGGAIFGLCHLGVVKALFLRGLLPRIITGTATGALIAALVAVHTEEELPQVLTGDSIDLSAFLGTTTVADAEPREKKVHWYGDQARPQSFRTRWETLLRRIQRFRRDGYFLDFKVLEDCVRANVGDLTFEEAYRRSKRVLNITVATASQGGVPTLLNHITAPNVLIWTAAVASNASSATLSLYGHGETRVLCKDPDGNVVPWKPANTVEFRHWTHVSYSDGNSPLLRIAELFNVNHFIVSQARPYLIPFLQSDMHGPSTMLEVRDRSAALTTFLLRMVGFEIRHRLQQLAALGLMPAGIRRFLVDEHVPGASVTLVPEVTTTDFVRLLETPTTAMLDYWILRGERSVWPAIAALRARCAIETELDRAYQMARRLKAGWLLHPNSSITHIAGTRRGTSAVFEREPGWEEDKERARYQDGDGEREKGKGKEGHHRRWNSKRASGADSTGGDRDRARSTGAATRS